MRAGSASRTAGRRQDRPGAGGRTCRTRFLSSAEYFFSSLVTCPILDLASSKTCSSSSSRFSSSCSRALLFWFEMALQSRRGASAAGLCRVPRDDVAASYLMASSCGHQTHIFFSISACFFFRSKLASMLALSCRTILPCQSHHTLHQQAGHSYAKPASPGPPRRGSPGRARDRPGDRDPNEADTALTFSIANSSSALTLISRAFSSASCLMNAVCRFAGTRG